MPVFGSIKQRVLDGLPTSLIHVYERHDERVADLRVAQRRCGRPARNHVRHSTCGADHTAPALLAVERAM